MLHLSTGRLALSEGGIVEKENICGQGTGGLAPVPPLPSDGISGATTALLASASSSLRRGVNQISGLQALVGVKTAKGQSTGSLLSLESLTD